MTMDWARYRACCDRGDVHSRYLLERTAILLDEAGEAALAARLRGVVQGEPVTKPVDHWGGSESDFFELDLEILVIERIAAVLRRARQAGACTPEGRSLGGFVEAWQEYLDWETGRHPRSPRRASRQDG